MATEPVLTEGIANNSTSATQDITIIEQSSKNPGGRPPGSQNTPLSQSELREYIRNYFGNRERLNNILETGYLLAIGKVSYINGRNDDGSQRIYDIPPDRQAWYRICELIGGRATQPIAPTDDLNNKDTEEIKNIMRKLLERKK